MTTFDGLFRPFRAIKIHISFFSQDFALCAYIMPLQGRNLNLALKGRDVTAMGGAHRPKSVSIAPFQGYKILHLFSQDFALFAYIMPLQGRHLNLALKGRDVTAMGGAHRPKIAIYCALSGL